MPPFPARSPYLDSSIDCLGASAFELKTTSARKAIRTLRMSVSSCPVVVNATLD